MTSTKHKLVSSIFALLLCSFCQVAIADLDQGIVAFEKENFTVAWRELLPLAVNGNAKAQNIVGHMYGVGQGVQKNKDESVYWLTKSAVQGNAEAADFLMAVYEHYQDYMREYQWATISLAMASISRNYDMFEIFDLHFSQSKELTNQDKKEALRLAKKWLKENGKENELEWLEVHAAIPAKPLSRHSAMGRAWLGNPPSN